jgi:hypothetical protein
MIQVEIWTYLPYVFGVSFENVATLKHIATAVTDINYTFIQKLRPD